MLCTGTNSCLGPRPKKGHQQGLGGQFPSALNGDAAAFSCLHWGLIGATVAKQVVELFWLHILLKGSFVEQKELTNASSALMYLIYDMYL